MSFTVDVTHKTWSNACQVVFREKNYHVVSQAEIEKRFGIQYVNPDGTRQMVAVTFPSEAAYTLFLLKVN